MTTEINSIGAKINGAHVPEKMSRIVAAFANKKHTGSLTLNFKDGVIQQNVDIRIIDHLT